MIEPRVNTDGGAPVSYTAHESLVVQSQYGAIQDLYGAGISRARSRAVTASFSEISMVSLSVPAIISPLVQGTLGAPVCPPPSNRWPISCAIVLPNGAFITSSSIYTCARAGSALVPPNPPNVVRTNATPNEILLGFRFCTRSRSCHSPAFTSDWPK